VRTLLWVALLGDCRGAAEVGHGQRLLDVSPYGAPRCQCCFYAHAARLPGAGPRNILIGLGVGVVVIGVVLLAVWRADCVCCARNSRTGGQNIIGLEARAARR
jgi:hypothetical protein